MAERPIPRRDEATVLIVENDARVREGLRAIVDLSDGLAAVATGCPVEALRIDAELAPDVVVLDVLLPTEAEGLTLVHRLAERGRCVVAIGIRGGLAPAALAAGARDFIENDTGSASELIHALRSAAASSI